MIVAEVPLQVALTSANIVQHPELGPAFAELMQLGVLDERNAVMLALLIERLRGEDSPYAPWLRLLPEQYACRCWGQGKATVRQHLDTSTHDGPAAIALQT